MKKQELLTDNCIWLRGQAAMVEGAIELPNGLFFAKLQDKEIHVFQMIYKKIIKYSKKITRKGF